MADFSADQIIDKTLVAKVNVKAFYGFPNSSSSFDILAGHNIGVVYSYIYPADKKNLWWEFFDNGGKVFWVEHGENKFDIQSLQQQGAITVEDQIKQKQEEAAKENEGTIPYYIGLYGKKIAIGAVVAYLAGKLIQGLSSRKNG